MDCQRRTVGKLARRRWRKSSCSLLWRFSEEWFSLPATYIGLVCNPTSRSAWRGVSHWPQLSVSYDDFHKVCTRDEKHWANSIPHLEDRLADIMHGLSEGVHVYLRGTPELAFERTGKRNRQEEKSVTVGYLKMLNGYMSALFVESQLQSSMTTRVSAPSKNRRIRLWVLLSRDWTWMTWPEFIIVGVLTGFLMSLMSLMMGLQEPFMYFFSLFYYSVCFGTQ